MRFKRYCQIEHGLGQISIVPLINIILLILFFFIISPFLTFQSGINVKLPRAVTSEVTQKENLIVTITSENVIYINRRISTINDLEQTLNKKENMNRPVFIKADRRASLGRIIDVWGLCRNLGVEKINIATD